MTDEELLRERHRAQSFSAYCNACGDDWPCRTIRVLDRLGAAEARCAAANLLVTALEADNAAMAELMPEDSPDYEALKSRLEAAERERDVWLKANFNSRWLDELTETRRRAMAAEAENTRLLAILENVRSVYQFPAALNSEPRP